MTQHPAVIEEFTLPSIYKVDITKPVTESLVRLPVTNTENVIPKNTQNNMVVYLKELSSKINCFLNSLLAQKIPHD